MAGGFQESTTVNQFDILQLLGSLTISNVGGSGLRTDLHFGRMTLDFGKRRYVARNDFRNTTNAFDGVHWQVGEGQNWRFRAFLVEPVIRDLVRLDQQTAKSVFWGAYVESAHIPWFNVNAYYFGIKIKSFKIKIFTVHIVRTVYAYSSLPRLTNSIMNSRGPFKRESLGNVEHFAYNPNVEAGYTFNLPWTPRFLAQYSLLQRQSHSRRKPEWKL